MICLPEPEAPQGHSPRSLPSALPSTLDTCARRDWRHRKSSRRRNGSARGTARTPELFTGARAVGYQRAFKRCRARSELFACKLTAPLGAARVKFREQVDNHRIGSMRSKPWLAHGKRGQEATRLIKSREIRDRRRSIAVDRGDLRPHIQRETLFWPCRRLELPVEVANRGFRNPRGLNCLTRLANRNTAWGRRHNDDPRQRRLDRSTRPPRSGP